MKERRTSELLQILPDTRRLLDEIQQQTGRPVEIQPDPSVRGRGRAIYVVTDPDLSRHLVLFDPEQAAHLNHLVAHECGHIVRFAAAEPGERRVPVMTSERRRLASRQLLPELSRLVRDGVPEGAVADVLPTWLSGTIAQLSDTPADVYIERWLWDAHPGLRAAQEASLRAQVQTLQLVHRPVVAAFTPEPIWRASDAMNYALVKAVSRLLQDPSLVHPYGRSDAQRLGDELLEMVDASPDIGLAGDRRLSELWAARLGVGVWLEWRTLDTLPRDFKHAWE
jgi:hypothetical protein